MHELSLASRLILILLPALCAFDTSPQHDSPHVEVEMMTADNHVHEQMEIAQQLKMQARITGKGRPLVLVGGGLTGWVSWEPHAERLAATRTVARLQPLSVQFGLENRALPEGYSVDVESAALGAALDDLGWRDSVDLVGWSYGALIALDFALDHPERIRTLTLIEPPAAWILPDNGRGDSDITALPVVQAGDDVTESDLEAFVRAAGLLQPGANAKELPQWPVWMEHRRSIRSISYPLAHEDDPRRLRALDRPVLLVTGTDTKPYYRRIQDALVAALPRVRHIEMPAGHGPHIVSMDRFLAELARFHEFEVLQDGDVSPSQDVHHVTSDDGHVPLSQDVHHVTSEDGTSIGYLRRGTGRPVLFVHGTTADHRSWTAVTPHLESHIAVHAMDRRGRGLSGDAPNYHISREAEDVAAVVDAIGEPVVVFGHSYGGLVALEAALLTENISKLILYEPALPTGIPSMPAGFPGRIRGLVEGGELEAAMDLFLTELAQIPEHELAVYRSSPLWEPRIPLARTIPRELAVEETYRFDSNRFSGLRTPTMLLQGGDSPDVYRRTIETLTATLPMSRVVVLPGQQHVAHHLAPELLASEVLKAVLDQP